MNYLENKGLNLDILLQRFKGKMFGELILHHLHAQSPKHRIQALSGTTNELPGKFRETKLEIFIDDINQFAYQEWFWKDDCSFVTRFILNIGKKRFLQSGVIPTEEDLFNVFQVIILNFAYGAQQQPEMANFIKRLVSKNIFDYFKRGKDISESYRWSIAFRKNGISHYEMLGDNVSSMLGHFMLKIGRNGNPVSPWELILLFNKTKQEIKLIRNYFPNENTITSELYAKIETIDPGYQVSSYKPELFFNRMLGEKIFMPTMADLEFESTASLECLKNGTWDEWSELTESEVTFYSVLNSIFN